MLNFLYGPDLFKDFKFKMNLILPSVSGLTKMDEISSLESYLMWAMTLFSRKFCISFLANSVSSSWKVY